MPWSGGTGGTRIWCHRSCLSRPSCPGSDGPFINLVGLSFLTCSGGMRMKGGIGQAWLRGGTFGVQQTATPSSSEVPRRTDTRAVCWALPGCWMQRASCQAQGAAQNKPTHRFPGGGLRGVPCPPSSPGYSHGVLHAPPLESIGLHLHPASPVPRPPPLPQELCILASPLEEASVWAARQPLRNPYKKFGKKMKVALGYGVGIFAVGWEQCRTKQRADLIYRKSLLEEKEMPKAQLRPLAAPRQRTPES